MRSIFLKMLVPFVPFCLTIIIFGLPNILIPRMLKDKAYSPLVLNETVPFYTVDETFAYAPKVQSSLRDGFFLKDPQLIEFNKSPNLYISESLPAKILSWFALATGSVSSAFVAADYIFPALNYLLVLALLYILTKNLLLSSVGSFFTIVCSYLLKTAQYPRSLLIRIVSEMQTGTLLPFARSFHPQITFLIFISSVIFLYLFLKKLNRKYILLTGLFWGLLFYSYIYYLAYFSTFFFLIALYYLLKKKFDILKGLLISSVIAMLIAVPYILEFIGFIRAPHLFNNLQLNLVNSPDDNFWLNFKIIFTMIIIFIALRKRTLTYFFFEILFLSGLLLCNLQYILNKNIHLSGHLEVRVIYPLIAISLLTVLGSLSLSKLKRKLFYIFLGCIFIFTGFYGFFNHYSYSKTFFESYTMPVDESDLYQWLNKNTTKGSVVMSSSFKTNMMISSLTSNFVYIPHSFMTFAPSEQLLERVFISHKIIGSNINSIKDLFKVTDKKLENIIKRRWDFDSCGQWFVYFTRYSDGNYYQCFIPEEEVNKISALYKDFSINENSINKYKFDYVIFGPYEKTNGDLETLKKNISVQEVYKNGSYLVFKR